MGPPYPPGLSFFSVAERNLQKTVALFQPRDVLTDLQCSYVYSQVTASRIACVDLAQIILPQNFASAVCKILHPSKRNKNRIFTADYAGIKWDESASLAGIVRE